MGEGEKGNCISISKIFRGFNLPRLQILQSQRSSKRAAGNGDAQNRRVVASPLALMYKLLYVRVTRTSIAWYGNRIPTKSRKETENNATLKRKREFKKILGSFGNRIASVLFTRTYVIYRLKDKTTETPPSPFVI